jgi:hypothetical protein
MRKYEPAFVGQVLELAEALFDSVEGHYGNLCWLEEYIHKNRKGWWLGPHGNPQGGAGYGGDLRKHLPGLYWANMFGPLYIEFFGADRIRSAPAHEIRTRPRSCTLLSSASPDDWGSERTKMTEDSLREHLGSDAFFLLAKPDRPTRSPFSRRTPTADISSEHGTM